MFIISPAWPMTISDRTEDWVLRQDKVKQFSEIQHGADKKHKKLASKLLFHTELDRLQW